MNFFRSFRPGLLMIMFTLFYVSLGERSAVAQDPPAPLKAGFAEVDVSPDLGMEMPGNYMKMFHGAFHDPCKVRAAVFGEGDNRTAVVSLDALMIHRPQVLAARKLAAEQTGISENAILIHATHSHSSGPTGMVLPGEFDGASEQLQKLAYEESSAADPVYLARVEAGIVKAVVDADANRQQALFNVGYGQEDQVIFNRRFRMQNGQTWTHPGAGNPDIIEPAGPIDPQVGVIGVWDDAGKLNGCLVNFSCHATTNPAGGISANLVFYVEKVIRGMFGEDVVVVYLAGASGDVTQVDNLTRTVNPQATQWAQMVGGSIGAEAVKVLVQAQPGPFFTTKSISETLKIARRVPSPENVKKAYDILAQGKIPGSTDWIFAKETAMLDWLCQTSPIVDVEVQAVQIGPVVLVTNPAEYFCAYGLEIKAGSSFPFTFPVSLANGCVGYVPTLEAFSERGGGYETRLSSYSNLDIHAGDQIAKTGIELAGQLQPDAVPERDKIPDYRPTGWTYGNLPPQLD